MLCTFIQEKYCQKDSSSVAEAIDDIFSPLNNAGWSSSGVYSFWHPDTKEILYIGLAVDLAVRFRQHNKLVKFDPKACKSVQISDFFKINTYLGYSVLVQSAYSQPSCKRFNVKNFLTEKEAQIQYDELVSYGYEAIVSTEGLLIEAHKLAMGRKPKWNKAGGSKLGSSKATENHMQLLKICNGEVEDWMLARKTIREISSNPTFEAYEHYLHGIRQYAIIHQLKFTDAIDKWHENVMVKSDPYLTHLRDEIISTNYLK